MAKKLKELAGSDRQVTARIRESAAQIWLAGLGAFAKAQEEGGKIFEALVKEGEAAQKRGGKIFEALVKEGEAVQKRGMKAAEERVAEFRDRATGSWDKLEKVFEDRVAKALHSLNVPTKKDIDGLSRRIEKLTAVADKLSASMEHGRHPQH